jgi:hypothetical protein
MKPARSIRLRSPAIPSSGQQQDCCARLYARPHCFLSLCPVPVSLRAPHGSLSPPPGRRNPGLLHLRLLIRCTVQYSNDSELFSGTAVEPTKGIQYCTIA